MPFRLGPLLAQQGQQQADWSRPPLPEELVSLRASGPAARAPAAALRGFVPCPRKPTSEAVSATQQAHRLPGAAVRIKPRREEDLANFSSPLLLLLAFIFLNNYFLIQMPPKDFQAHVMKDTLQNEEPA